MDQPKLDSQNAAAFDGYAKLTFSEQGMAFLNAFWDILGDQADFMWEACRIMKAADMHTKGVTLITEYREGTDLDFQAGLYFYEKLNHFVHDDPQGRKWSQDPQYKKSMPEMMTAIERKKVLREQDINFDNRISFLEYLLYQYREHCSPDEFTKNVVANSTTNPELKDATEALAAVNLKIVEFERTKRKLEKEIKEAKEQEKLARLKQKKFELDNLRTKFAADGLDAGMIKAQALIRKVTTMAQSPSADKFSLPKGTAWWLSKELEEKKKLYGNNAALMASGNKAKAKNQKPSDMWIKK